MKVFGVFGELIQGYEYDKENKIFKHFLFTLPVKELYTHAYIDINMANNRIYSNKLKSWRALELLGLKYNIDVNKLSLTIDSNIPEERGHASSTADIVATCKCFFNKFLPALEVEHVDLEILKILKAIEYSDYLLHRGISSCYQREQKLIYKYKTNLQLRILGVDEGNLVNTEQFHITNNESMDKVVNYENLKLRLHNALMSNDFVEIGKLSTESAILHNDKLPKKNIHLMQNIQHNVGGLGICVAHSGSLIGIIFSEHQVDFEYCFTLAKETLRKNKLIFRTYTLLES